MDRRIATIARDIAVIMPAAVAVPARSVRSATGPSIRERAEMQSTIRLASRIQTNRCILTSCFT